MSSPAFPPELERKIFEMALDPFERSSSSRMMLVARRSRTWIRPLVYAIFDQRRVPTYRQNPFPNFKKLPPSVDLEEICLFAKHLVIDATLYTIAEVNTLIYQCSNLVNLALWGGLDILHHQDPISSLDHLQRLSVTFKNIKHNTLETSTVFRSLTHLELLYPPNDFSSLEIASLSRLTYLSIYPNTTESDTHYQKWETVITSCPQICVFLFCLSTHSLSPGLKTVFDLDPRVVFVDYSMNDADDWQRGAQGMPDIWDHASRVVFARRNGYFQPNYHTPRSLSQKIPWLDYLTEEGKKWFQSL